MSITPFKINIPDSELDLLTQKLALTRIPPSTTDYTDDNGITASYLHSILDHWRTTYSWRDHEAHLNFTLPQYTTSIPISDDFGTIDIHFVHSPSTKPNATPLLFLHGWPGSFIEIEKGLKRLNDEGFHVVAPSLPGYGFSGYPRKKGFNLRKVAEVLHKLMVQRLDYSKFVIQGGDWGSHVTRVLALLYPDSVLAAHVNMFEMPLNPFTTANKPEPAAYTPSEQARLHRFHHWFSTTNKGYSLIHAQKPITLGTGLHDSPLGLLTWLLDKLILWTDSYPWTFDEIITWTLLHYFPGPTTSMLMYHENPREFFEEEWFSKGVIKVPFGVSVFPKELAVMPRAWVEEVVVGDLRFWREHEKGGHFAMHERSEVLVEDVVEFYRGVLDREGR